MLHAMSLEATLAGWLTDLFLLSCLTAALARPLLASTAILANPRCASDLILDDEGTEGVLRYKGPANAILFHPVYFLRKWEDKCEIQVQDTTNHHPCACGWEWHADERPTVDGTACAHHPLTQWKSIVQTNNVEDVWWYLTWGRSSRPSKCHGWNQ